MLILVSVFLVLCMVLSRSMRGPVWVMCLAWLVCIAPLALGLIEFDFLDSNSLTLAIAIVTSVLCFIAGAMIERSFGGRPRATPLSGEQIHDDLKATRPLATFCWVLGMIGGACVFADFIVSGGVSSASVAELRESYVLRDSASIFGKIGSVLTWACLYSYAFALVFRLELPRLQFIAFASPVAAFLLTAILSAGRQAAFQILLITILAEVMSRIRHGPRARRSGRTFTIAVSLLTIVYMSVIAVVRNDNRVSYLKSEVLEALFQCHVSPIIESATSLFGSGFNSAVVETLVYFSGPVALFERFLDTGLVGDTYGAMNFPFIFRQIQPITGLNVMDLYQLKVAALNSEGLVGVGWTTSVSSLIMDFGYVGAGVVLVLQGFYSSYSWRKAIAGGDFHDLIIAILMLVAAIYLPLLPAFSDTNLLFLLLFCILVKVVRRGARRLGPAVQPQGPPRRTPDSA